MGKGLGSVEKKQNSKKAWGVGGRQLQTLKTGWGMLGLGQKGREKRGRDGATIYLLENKKAYLN